jgi:hypothetical protein
MRRLAALAVSVSVLLWVPVASGIINIPSSTSFNVEAHGISGVVKSRNPRCRTHRTVLLTLRALTEEESGLDFYQRPVHTGKSHSWRLSTGIPAKAFTLEVLLTAKSLGNSQGSNQCLGFFKERAYNIGR